MDYLKSKNVTLYYTHTGKKSAIAERGNFNLFNHGRTSSNIVYCSNKDPDAQTSKDLVPEE